METRFEGLQQKASYRSKRLQDSNKLFNFYREADEVESWIIERESIATSDDYGRDLEHVETLLKKFEDFMRDLVTSGERIAVLTAQAQALLDEGNSEEEVRQAFCCFLLLYSAVKFKWSCTLHNPPFFRCTHDTISEIFQ